MGKTRQKNKNQLLDNHGKCMMISKAEVSVAVLNSKRRPILYSMPELQCLQTRMQCFSIEAGVFKSAAQPWLRVLCRPRCPTRLCRGFKVVAAGSRPRPCKCAQNPRPPAAAQPLPYTTARHRRQARPGCSAAHDHWCSNPNFVQADEPPCLNEYKVSQLLQQHHGSIC